MPLSDFMDRETEAQSRTLLGESWAEVGHKPLQSRLLSVSTPTHLPCPAPPASSLYPGRVVKKTQCSERAMTNDCPEEIIHY